jgi:acyl-CoA dehydrogenase
MKSPWPTEARAFQESIAGTLDRLGGIDVARACESEPRLRAERIAPALDALNLDDLDPSAGPADAAVASLGLRAAGHVVCPWPLVPRLAVPRELRKQLDAVYLVDGDPARLEHLDLVPRAGAYDIRSGELREVVPVAPPSSLPLDPFGVPCRLGERINGTAPPKVLGSSIVLAAYWVLGALDRVLRQVAAYAAERHQFGRPIASFGAIQWRLSDLAVAHAGLEELAGYTLLRFGEARATRADLLALRLYTLVSAKRGMQHGHQILGAIGLCEEHDVTLIDRHLQPALRRQGGVAATTRMLSNAIAEIGFDAIYPIVPTPAGRSDGNGRSRVAAKAP